MTASLDRERLRVIEIDAEGQVGRDDRLLDAALVVEQSHSLTIDRDVYVLEHRADATTDVHSQLVRAICWERVLSDDTATRSVRRTGSPIPRMLRDEWRDGIRRHREDGILVARSHAAHSGGSVQIRCEQ